MSLTDSLDRHGVGEARLALVLGSGLGGLVERMRDARTIPYAELDGMPTSSVPGHAGRLVLGTLADVPVVVQQGRVHLYEGWSIEEVTRAARAFARLGIPGLVLTNAAGGLMSDWEIPSLMRVTDHVNLQPFRPETEGTTGAASGRVYDDDLGDVLDLAAKEVGNSLNHGIYAGLLGPSYETPAEIRMLRWAGVHAVGMSTVAEAAAARHAGMRVCAVSCISNPAAGISSKPLTHEEVVAASAQIADALSDLLEAAAPQLDSRISTS